ncbi:DUF2878 domain-containing protein [Metapseudomonas furukawaii]
MPRLIANALLFQLGWLACVLASQRPWLLVIVPAILAIHFFWVASWAREGRMIATVFFLGSALDSFLGNLGVFDFPGESRLLPLWLALLWALLATTLNHSLAWSARPWWRASLLGALFAPPAYLAGARLADVSLPLGTITTLALLALIWALVLPLLHQLAAISRATAKPGP